MKLTNPTDQTLKFDIAGKPYKVAPGGTCTIPDRLHYAVRNRGLPLEPVVGKPAPAEEDEDESDDEDAPEAELPEVDAELICEDLDSETVMGTVLTVTPDQVVLELEDGRRWPVKPSRITEGTWTHDADDYPARFRGLDEEGHALFAEAADAEGEAKAEGGEPETDAKASKKARKRAQKD